LGEEGQTLAEARSGKPDFCLDELISMGEYDRLARQIKDLKEKSGSSVQLDEKIADVENMQKRAALVNSLEEAIKLILHKGRKAALHNLTNSKQILVDTRETSLPRGGVMQEGIFPSLHYDFFYFGLNPDEHTYDIIDNPQWRAVYLDEFQERCKILVEAVKRGELDEFFGFPPYEVLHQINGRYGELLPRLGIDPRKGRTYSYMMNLFPPRKKPKYRGFRY
jgi:hypothetical protein